MNQDGAQHVLPALPRADGEPELIEPQRDRDVTFAENQQRNVTVLSQNQSDEQAN